MVHHIEEGVMGDFIYSRDVEELEGHPPFGDGECIALPKETTSVG